MAATAKETLHDLASNVTQVVATGCDVGGISRLKNNAADLQTLSHENPEFVPLAEDLQRALEAESDEVPFPLLDLLERATTAQKQFVEFTAPRGELKEIPEGNFWSTPMPMDSLYKLIPETRPFAKRAKPPEQVETIESAARRGTVADLRLIQLFLKSLGEKAGAVVPDAIARVALPAFGPAILPDLWPTLGPENRSFVAAYKIDIQATLARLLEKTGKKSDKSGSVMKAVRKIMDSVSDDGTTIGPESLPLFKLAMKYAPEAAFRHEIAETLAKMGNMAVEALPEMIDAFEHVDLKRDYHLIRPMVVLGKESPEVADALIRALTDRDNVVRLLAAFNLGQMGAPALGAMSLLENISEVDQDPKVREQAARTLNKLRLRLALANPQSVEEEVEETEEQQAEVT
jgi:hypothetical protein